jgi:hypothetical protein
MKQIEGQYILTDTRNNTVQGKPVTLTDKEVERLNYGYALNHSDLRYLKV